MTYFDEMNQYQWLFNVLEEINTTVQRKYQSGHFSKKLKDDHSPVTSIDLWVHKRLETCLSLYDKSTPVISEESVSTLTSQLFLSHRFWLIDPIDGTQEMINKTGDFCICVSLIEHFKAKLGFIAIPKTGEVFFGDSELKLFGSIYKKKFKGYQALKSRKDTIVLQSRFHFDANVENMYSKLAYQIAPQTLQRQVVGSAIKFIYVALDKADGFIKTNETYAWDSAAGSAIVQAAGGQVALLNGEPILYNQIKHSGFFVESKKGFFNLV